MTTSKSQVWVSGCHTTDESNLMRTPADPQLILHDIYTKVKLVTAYSISTNPRLPDAESLSL